MKSALSLIIVLIAGVITAQNESVLNNSFNNLSATLYQSMFMYGSTFQFYNPKRAVEGSVYLFKDWNNYAVIITNDNRKFLLKNINLNIQRNTFESKISEDSVFIFDINNIDKFVINNKVFKNFFYNGENRVYEMIYESDSFSILKSYRIVYTQSSTNSIYNLKITDKIKKKYLYYLKKGDNIEPFKLKKSSILNLVSNEQTQNLEQYVKENKLSYKKEKDVSKILNYISKS